MNSFQIENPFIVKDKDNVFYITNNEIIKIRINILFSLFEKFLDKEKFKDSVQAYLEDKKLNEKQFFDALNNRQKLIEIIKKFNIKISDIIGFVVSNLDFAL